VAQELTIKCGSVTITATKVGDKPHFLPRNKVVQVGEHTVMCDSFTEALALMDMTQPTAENDLHFTVAEVPDEYARRRKNGNGAKRGPPRGAPRQRRERAPR